MPRRGNRSISDSNRSNATSISSAALANRLPTVVICANDAQAAGAMTRAREIGLRLPEDLSFIGFDDVGIARVVTPTLATVRVPQMEMGRAAARLLLDRIAGRADLSSAVFPTTFVPRASLAPPSEA